VGASAARIKLREYDQIAGISIAICITCPNPGQGDQGPGRLLESLADAGPLSGFLPTIWTLTLKSLFMPSLQSHRRTGCRAGAACSLLGSVVILGSLTPLPLLAAVPAPGPSTLYRLATTCAVAGAPPVNCDVEAVDEGASTFYRHTIGKDTKIVRITDDPVSMTMWNESAKKWESLRNASARFSANTVCFNDRELCVINPNYLNSIRQDDLQGRFRGRDLIKVHFDAAGRIDASCYDDACALVKP
jgi:hypothetical protein